MRRAERFEPHFTYFIFFSLLYVYTLYYYPLLYDLYCVLLYNLS